METMQKSGIDLHLKTLIGRWTGHNNRYEFDSGLRNSGVANGQIGYQNIKTVTLDASNEGVRYTPVGAGIRIDDSSGSSEIIITQIQSQQAVFDELNRQTVQGDTIGTANARLYEDGVPTAWNPANSSGHLNTTNSIALCADFMPGRGLKRSIKHIEIRQPILMLVNSVTETSARGKKCLKINSQKIRSAKFLNRNQGA